MLNENNRKDNDNDKELGRRQISISSGDLKED